MAEAIEAAALQRGLAALAPRPPPLPLLQPPQPAPDRPPAPGRDPGRRLPPLAQPRLRVRKGERGIQHLGALPAVEEEAARVAGSGREPGGAGRGPTSAWSRSSTAPRSTRCRSSPAARSSSSPPIEPVRATASPTCSSRWRSSAASLGFTVAVEAIPGAALGYCEPHRAPHRRRTDREALLGERPGRRRDPRARPRPRPRRPSRGGPEARPTPRRRSSSSASPTPSARRSASTPPAARSPTWRLGARVRRSPATRS